MASRESPIAGCEFSYRCPRNWESLLETNVDSVRFCPECDRNVYLSTDSVLAQARANAGQCVAIPIEVLPASQRLPEDDGLAVGFMKRAPLTDDERKELRYVHARATAPFVGIDGCPGGWFYAGIEDDGSFTFGVLDEFEEVARLLEHATLVLVDMPIGLPDEDHPVRECDSLARRAIAPHGSSVFPTPARSTLALDDYQEANQENRRRLGRGLSRQSWALAPRIREVDAFMRSERPDNVREIHPEVAFWALNGGVALQHKKKKRAGIDERLALLEKHYERAWECYEVARRAYLRKTVRDDDIVDALVGAVTARLHPRLATFPRQPSRDGEGLAMEIVYALDMELGG